MKQLFKKYKVQISNFGYLSLFQLFNMFLPLITYPYLIRVLGVELYGTVVFAMAISSYFSIFINFGFNISATKNVSKYRNDKNKLSEIYSSVLTIKTFIWVVSLIVLVTLVNLIPFFNSYKMY